MVAGVDLVAALLDPETWKLDAACREHPELSWVPERGESVDAQLEVCAGCLVRAECLAYVRRTAPAMPGIWGGTTARERRRPRNGAA
jgi:WhiB family redox-sensing transcriptional regulator